MDAGGKAGSNDDLVQGFGDNDTIIAADGPDVPTGGKGDDSIDLGAGDGDKGTVVMTRDNGLQPIR